MHNADTRMRRRHDKAPRPVSAILVLHDPLDWLLEAQVVTDVLRGGACARGRMCLCLSVTKCVGCCVLRAARSVVAAVHCRFDSHRVVSLAPVIAQTLNRNHTFFFFVRYRVSPNRCTVALPRSKLPQVYHIFLLRFENCRRENVCWLPHCVATVSCDNV